MGPIFWIVMTSGPLQNFKVALGTKVELVNLWPGLFLIVDV